MVSVALTISCASTPTGELITSTTPVGGPLTAATTDTIAFLGVEFPSVGAHLGYHHDGLLKVRQSSVYLTSDLLARWSQGLRDHGTEMLRNAGYRLHSISPLFAQVQRYAGVQHALAGRITALSVNTFGALAGGKTQVAISIDWEVLDVSSRDVVYRRESTGEAAVGGTSGAAISHAFQAAFLTLLQDPNLVGAFKPRSVPAAQEFRAVPGVWTRPPPSPNAVLTIRRGDLKPFAARSGLERALKATMTLVGDRAGGSAFLITRSGLALTNYHVIAGQRSLEARFADGRRFAVRVLRADSVVDAALIEVACDSQCTTLELDPALAVEVGAEVYALGTPLSEDLTNTVTRGIISAIRLDHGTSLLQTDAAINPGNSGGPLIDATSGLGYGIVTFKVTGRAEGLGFGVAIPDALRVLGVRYLVERR
jgi:S1-C subfamily serine protease